MYAAIRRYELGNGSPEDLARVVDEGLVPALKAEPGFIGYYAVASGVSPVGGEEVVSVTFFDDEATAARSNVIAAAFVKDHLDEFKLNLTSAMSGTVVLTRNSS